MKTTPEPLTLGTIAKYCHVDRVTVQRWVKSGKIQAYRTPGGHYRVPKAEFRKFLVKYKMPLYPEFFEELPPKILIAGATPEEARELANLVKARGPNYEVKTCNSSQEALILLGCYQPDILILDLDLDELGGAEICYTIKNTLPNGTIRILGISSDPAKFGEDANRADLDTLLKKPVVPEEFQDAVQEIAGIRRQ